MPTSPPSWRQIEAALERTLRQQGHPLDRSPPSGDLTTADDIPFGFNLTELAKQLEQELEP